MRSTLFLTFFIFHGVAWASVQFFITEPLAEPYYVVAGHNQLNLPCSVNPTYVNNEQYSIYWIRIVDNMPFLIRNDKHYQIDNSSCTGCLNLNIHKLEYGRDNGKFYCQLASSDGVTSTSRAAEVIVMSPPNSPRLDKADLTLIEGRTEDVKCLSAGGNPSPVMTWFLSNGTEISHMATVKNASKLDEDTVSTLSLAASADHDGMTLVCKVWNIAMKQRDPLVVETNRVVVLFPPKVTVFPSSPYNVEKDQEARLFCSARGNPTPLLFTWQRTGGVIDSTWIEPNISFTAGLEQAGTYRCTAENTQGVSSADVNLVVQYGPQISLLDEVIVKEGDDLHLNCQVDSNPPPYMVSWDGPEVKIQNSSVLQLQSVTRRQAGSYSCQAKNLMTVNSAKGSAERVQTRSCRVIISYPPSQAVISVDEPVLVGSTVVMNCSAQDKGYPPAKYRWKLPGHLDYVYNGQATRTMTDVQLSHAGEYWCQPFNDAGNGQDISYRLVVREPARIVKPLKNEDITREDQSGYFLSCSAVGNPAPNITWYYDDEPISTERFSVVSRPAASSCEILEQCSLKVASILQWNSNVRWDNKGVYTCRADNGAGQPAESTVFLKVQHRPVIINDPERRTTAADLGETVSVVCKVTASPEPIFRWYHNGDALQAMDGTKLDSNQLRNHTFEVYENTLIIRNVSPDDLGPYSCKAANLFGDDSYTFKLERKRKPDAPSNLRVDSQTYMSILLDWTPGFDGGHGQQFTLEISRGGKLLKTLDVSAVSSGVEWKPSMGVERVLPVRHNVTGLEPSTFYSFRLKAHNKLGETDWSPLLTAVTKDAPLNKDIVAPDSAIYSSLSQTLEFQPSIDAEVFCLMIYLEKDLGLWERWDCVTASNYVEAVPMASSLRVRTCNIFTMECSEMVPVSINVARSNSLEVIAAVGCTVLLALLVLAVVCLYCRRRRTKLVGNVFTNGNLNGKNQDTKTIQKREISAPMYTDQVLNASNLGMDRTTASSKDSGVFTTFSNYPYDGYGVDPNVHAYSEGATLPRPVSYDGSSDHWAASGCRLSQNHISADALTTKDSGHLRPVAAYPQDFVDMNPAGGSLSPSRDDSLHSGYSTPLQKRIVREIIV